MKIFPIKEKVFEFELSYGSYNVYLTGGWHTENIDDLDIHLFDIDTTETITLQCEDFYGMRKQDYVRKQRAILAFSFDIQKYSNLKLTISNPEILVVKRQNPYLILHDLLFGNRNVPIEQINVVIK